MSTRFPIPIDAANVFAKNEKGKLIYHIGLALKDFNRAHPDKKIISHRSLVKRIVGRLSERYARLFCDRIMMDWLEHNRHRLSEIQKTRGAFRIVVLDLMSKDVLLSKPEGSIK